MSPPWLWVTIATSDSCASPTVYSMAGSGLCRRSPGSASSTGADGASSAMSTRMGGSSGRAVARPRARSLRVAPRSQVMTRSHGSSRASRRPWTNRRDSGARASTRALTAPSTAARLVMLVISDHSTGRADHRSVGGHKGGLPGSGQSSGLVETTEERAAAAGLSVAAEQWCEAFDIIVAR